jgi:mannose-6-phosphate isomerase-like protein (cupin superfamily)
MVKIFSKTGKLLNIVYQSEGFEGICRADITEPQEALQCAIVSAEAGKVFAPHKHLDRKCEIHIQEAFVILKGKAKIHVFDFDDSLVTTYPIKAGDLTVLLTGGHSLEIEEDCVFWEFKNGPYEGQAKDKIFISE